MSLNKPLASLEVLGSESAVVLFVQYGSGGFEVFSVPLNKIIFRETFNVQDFAKAIEAEKEKKEQSK